MNDIAPRKMHQTTVRFGAELWARLEAEAAADGVSAAQYVRDATLARLTYAAGRRGDPDFDRALAPRARVLGGLDDGAAAVWANGRLAQERALRSRASDGGNATR